MRWWVMAAMVLSCVVAVGVTAPRAATVAAKQADDDCMDNPLGPVPAYSVVTQGDFEEMNSESDGRVVVGRDGAPDQHGDRHEARRWTGRAWTSRSGAT